MIDLLQMVARMDNRVRERRKRPFEHFTTYELVVELIKRMSRRDFDLISDRQLRILRNESMWELDKRHSKAEVSRSFK